MVDMGTLKYWCCATQNFCTHSQQRRVTLQEIILCTSLPRPRFQYANPLLFSRPLENGNKKQYSMSYYQLRVLLLFFTLIIVNNIAPPPPTRDFNNNTYDCNEESGRSALIWQQIINKSAPPPEIRDHPLFAVVVSLICGGSLWAVVVVKFHRVINNTTWYYDQSYTIMTLCKHGLVDGGVQ